MMIQKGFGQVFSSPSSPNKDSILLEANKNDNRMAYAVSVIEQPPVGENPDSIPKQMVPANMAASMIQGNMSALSGQNSSA